MPHLGQTTIDGFSVTSIIAPQYLQAMLPDTGIGASFFFLSEAMPDLSNTVKWLKKIPEVAELRHVV